MADLISITVTTPTVTTQANVSGNETTIINSETTTLKIDAQGGQGIQGVAGVAGVAGVGVAIGGTTGQVLSKLSNTNYDTAWTTVTGGAGGNTTLTGDVTGAGTGTVPTVIGANKVTLANLSQIASGSFLARSTAALGNVEALTTAQVKTLLAISNVDNTSDAAKPISTAQLTALNLKADLASPTFSGTVLATAITASGNITALNLNGNSSGNNTGDQTNISGNAGTATVLQTARMINGVSFNGSAAITINAVDSTVRVPSTTTVTTTAPLTGGGALSSNLILALSPATGVAAGSMSSTDFTKLSGIATGATANSSDAFLLARSNHVGTQAGSTITGLASASGLTSTTGKLLGRSTAATGVLEEIILGTNLSFTGTTLNASGGGSGTVTSVSITPLNGISGTVATNTTTPTISLSLGAITPTSVAASGTVNGSNLSGTNTGDQTTVSGNAGTATTLQTARTINGVSFNGSANITVNAVDSTARVPTGLASASGLTSTTAKLLGRSTAGTGVLEEIVLGTNLSFTGNTLNATTGGGSGTVTSVSVTPLNGISGTVATNTTTPALTLSLGAITPTSVVSSGAISGANLSGTNTGDQATVSGNAGTATTLQTARMINGVAFDGSANVTVNAIDSTARVPSTTTISTTAPLAGGGALSGNLTLTVGASSGVVSGTMSSTDFTKLSGIASGATANSADASLRDRSTHTGTQTASTISDFNTSTRAQVEAELIAGANITITPASAGATRTLTISATASGGAGISLGKIVAFSRRPMQ